MKKVEASVEIDAPVADVFAYASDRRLWEDWWEGVSKFKPTTETSRGNGTRYAYKLPTSWSTICRGLSWVRFWTLCSGANAGK